MRVAARALFIAITMAAVCVAQDAPAKSAKKKVAPAKSEMAGMPMAKPGPEMQKLTKMLAGTWNTTESFEVTEMMPQGGKGTGAAVIKPGPGGMSLVEEYHSHGGLGSFSGHGVFWWDEKAKGYRNVWCDSMTPGGCAVANGLGNWEGDSLVFNDEQEMMGKKMAMKNELKPDGGAIVLTMSSGDSADSMKKVGTIRYVKGGAMAAPVKN